MTIGSLPPHPGMIRELTGRPSVVPKTLIDGEPFAARLTAIAADARDGQLGDTSIRENAERFNENGFFANSGTNAPGDFAEETPKLSPPQPPDLRTPSVTAMSAADLLGQVATPVTDSDVAAIRGGVRPAAEIAGLAPTAVRRNEALPMASAGSSAAPAVQRRALSPESETIEPLPFVKARQAANPASRSPIRVSVNSSDGTAAVAIAVRGLTDCQTEALRADIIALLRRHGLVLDDLKLNGRPMGQRRDRSKD